jgi:hypothetical protein
MTPLSFSAQTNDDRRAGQARGDCGRHMLGHSKPDYVSGRESLPLDRFSADFLPRATSQALRFNSACLGLYHLNAQLHVSRQAVRNALDHQIRLSCSASSSAERKARKAFHNGEKASHDRDFSHHESGQFSQEQSHV